VEAGPRTLRAARNAAVAAAAEVAGKVATLAFTVAAARTLSQADFGAFAYALSFSLLVATLPSWGFDALLIQRGSADPKRLRQMLSETLVWRTVVAVPVFLAAGIAGVAIRPTARSGVALAVVLVAVFIDIHSDAGRAAAAALQRQGGVSTALVVQRLITAGLAIGALAAGFGLIGLSVAYLAGTLVGAGGVVVSVRRLGLGLDLRSVGRAGLGATARLSLAVGLDAVAALALFRIDQVMLAAFKGDGAVGVYAAAYRLLETVLFLSWAVSRAVLPAMSASTETWRVRRGVEEGIAALAVLYVPFGVGLWIEAGPVLRFLYGSGYAAAGTTALRWLAGAPLLFAVGYLGGYGLLARGRRGRIVLATLVATTYNIGLNLILIPRLSGTGAAIVTTTSYALEAALTLVLLRSVIGWVRLHRSVGLPVAASAAMAVALLAMHRGVLVEVAAGMFVYGSVWYGLARWRAPSQLAVIASVAPWRR
jgi:O-antigen/teichoic acid export membrane protein